MKPHGWQSYQSAIQDQWFEGMKPLLKGACPGRRSLSSSAKEQQPLQLQALRSHHEYMYLKTRSDTSITEALKGLATSSASDRPLGCMTEAKAEHLAEEHQGTSRCIHMQ
mmetsp:Transcript_17785/g.48029  ORF Transcript_17785/g.48029 Transcript_17785/m.48029 type:complete len:110 (+) Transcript_17785:941-1270(+)